MGLLSPTSVFIQYYADANEADSWIQGMMPLAASEDKGKDESSADALLRRHHNLVEEIGAFDDDIKRLEDLAACMTKDSKLHGVSLAGNLEILNGNLKNLLKILEISEIIERKLKGNNRL